MHNEVSWRSYKASHAAVPGACPYDLPELADASLTGATPFARAAEGLSTVEAAHGDAWGAGYLLRTTVGEPFRVGLGLDPPPLRPSLAWLEADSPDGPWIPCPGTQLSRLVSWRLP